MFRFNISEKIILDLKGGNFKEDKFNTSNFLKIVSRKVLDKKVLICYGLSNDLREEFCFGLIYKIFKDIYVEDLSIQVFKIVDIEQLDELYLDNDFQIFYLYDFFGKIEIKSRKYEEYLDRILKSNNKILIINTRSFLENQINSSRFCDLKENLECNKVTLNNILNNISVQYSRDDFTDDLDDLNDIYLGLNYIDKLVLFYVFIGFSYSIDTWIDIMEKYLLHRNIFKDNNEFSELILNSFKKLEDKFIYLGYSNNFSIRNLLVDNFLRNKIKDEILILKDLFNNIYTYVDLYNMCSILKELNVTLNYTLEDYESSFKDKLININLDNSSIKVVSQLNTILMVFDVLHLWDQEIIDKINMKIVYSKLNIDDVIDYFFSIVKHKHFLINNDVFREKLLNLIYRFESDVDKEFYNYNFKYYLFISEFCNLYGNIYNEDLLDLENQFDILVSTIFNNINLYFSMEYFSLNDEIREALGDLKELIEKYNIEHIFNKNIYNIFNSIEYKLIELIQSVSEFIPKDIHDYHILVYFINELERNRDFIEENFVNVNLENSIVQIKEKIYCFQA